VETDGREFIFIPHGDLLPVNPAIIALWRAKAEPSFLQFRRGPGRLQGRKIWLKRRKFSLNILRNYAFFVTFVGAYFGTIPDNRSCWGRVFPAKGAPLMPGLTGR
jgi:hypothetical protein